MDLFSNTGDLPEQAHLDPEEKFARVMGEKERKDGVYYRSGICLICM